MSFISKAKAMLPLHLAFLLYSFSGVLSKSAGGAEFMSARFVLLYGGSLAILVVYSVIWQLLLRRYPLSVAYSGKGVIVVWGILWGLVFFGESLSIAKAAAAALVITGILVMGDANE